MSEGLGAPAAAPAAPSNGVSNGTPAPASSTATQAPGGDGATGTKPPDAGAQTATQSAAQVEKLLKKLRIGGKELEVDMAADETAREYQTLKHNAYKLERFQAEQRAFQAMQQRLASGDATALQELGIDVAALAQRAAEQQAQMAQMTPEQKRIAELEQALQAKETTAKQQQEMARRQAEAQRKQALKQRTFGELMSAAKAAGFPLETKAQRGAALAIAAKIRAAELKAGRADMTPEQLGQMMEKVTFSDLAHKLSAVTSNPTIRARRMAELKALHDASVTGLDGDALLDFYGPEQLKKIYAAGVSRLNSRNPTTGTPMPKQGATSGTGAPGEQVSSWAEARKKWNFG